MSIARPKTRQRKTSQAEIVIASKPKPLGWNTTDEDEIALRRWRGETEPMSVWPLESQYPYFGAFCVQSTPQHSYHVEIRHLSALVNSCDCPDFQHNGFGVCKHIEKTLCNCANAAVRNSSRLMPREVRGLRFI